MSECLGPLLRVPDPDVPEPEFPTAADPLPPPLPLPLLLPLPLEAVTAATSGDLAERAATTVLEAALADQTLSAISKTAVYVLAENSIDAMAFLTACGRDLRQIPSTVLAQWQPDRGVTP